jgi:hypothetical protein
MGKILCALSAKAINAQLFAAKTAETRFLNGVSADYKVAVVIMN